MTSGDWLFGIRVENTVRLPAFSMRFQREFDKYKNVGGRVHGKQQLWIKVKLVKAVIISHMSFFNCYAIN